MAGRGLSKMEMLAEIEKKRRYEWNTFHMFSGGAFRMSPRDQFDFAWNLQLNADPKAVDAKDKLGRTPLHLAIQNEKERGDIIQKLVESGCDVNITDKDGRTPFDMAVEKKRIDYLRLLIDAGCEIPEFYQELGELITA